MEPASGQISGPSQPRHEKRGILLVGPLPNPVGGVSSHLQRLTAYLVSCGMPCTVLDIYPDAEKVEVEGVVHEVSPVGGPLAMLWLISRLLVSRHEVVHLHFSQIVGRFLAVALLLAKRRRKLLVTLHHGDQASVLARANALTRTLARIALSRMDRVIALSEEQFEVFRSLGVPQGRLERWRTALPLTIEPDPTLLPAELQATLPIEDGGEETILLTSGYPERSYCYEHCIELLERLSSVSSCKLVICLYGAASDASYEAALREVARKHTNIVVVGALPPAGFLALLARASVYLRPSMVDSYGLAITDALNLGIPCLASDVCNRDPRCDLFPAGDKEAFFSRARELVDSGRRRLRTSSKSSTDAGDFQFIEDCYR